MLDQPSTIGQKKHMNAAGDSPLGESSCQNQYVKPRKKIQFKEGIGDALIFCENSTVMLWI